MRHFARTPSRRATISDYGSTDGAALNLKSDHRAPTTSVRPVAEGRRRIPVAVSLSRFLIDFDLFDSSPMDSVNDVANTRSRAEATSEMVNLVRIAEKQMQFPVSSSGWGPLRHVAASVPHDNMCRISRSTPSS